MLLDGQDKIEVSWNPKTREYYENKGYVFTKYYDKFLVDFNDIYPTSTTKIKVECDYCRKQYTVSYSSYRRSLTNGNKIACIHCVGAKAAEQSLDKRQEDIYQKLTKICNDKNYKLITIKNEIINNLSEISYICPVHGETHTKVTNLLQGKGCYKCGRMKALKNKASTTLRERQDNLYSKALNVAKQKDYTIITPKDEIMRNTSVIKYICSIHGEQQMRISNFITGRNCPKCAIDKNKQKYKLSDDEVEKRIKDLGGTLLNKTDYINRSTKNLKILCFNCNQEFTTSLQHFTQHGGQVCKKCSNKESLGEIKIKQFLQKNNILFESEKWFDNCRDINPLPFDFYLPDYNILIEYDGEQHYYDRSYKTGKFRDTLEYTQIHDKIKTNYCIKNNIKLIRVPYWDYNNIDIILNKELNLHEDIV